MRRCRRYQVLTVNHHRDLRKPRLGWRRELGQRRHQMPRLSPRNLVLCTRDRLRDRRMTCDMTSVWNTSWCYGQDGTACVGCEESIHANGTRNWRECTVMMGDESSAKQPRVDDPTPPDAGSAPSLSAGIRLSSTTNATSSAPVDTSGEKTPVRPTRPRSPGPPPSAGEGTGHWC